MLGSADARQGRRVVRLLEEIRQEERSPTATAPTFCGALFAAILALLAQGCRTSDAKVDPSQAAKETLKPELDYLDAHLGERQGPRPPGPVPTASGACPHRHQGLSPPPHSPVPTAA